MAVFGRVPSGSMGVNVPAGDLGGNDAVPLVVGFDGIPLVGTPTPGQVWELNGAGTEYVPVTPSGGGSGTVTSVSVVAANGIAGSVATSTTTPAITLSCSITGLLKGNGTAISAAVANTDYTNPAGLASALTPYATLASPALSGVPTAPTATAGTTTTQIATTAFVTGGIATAVTGLAPLASPTFTGTPAAPTAATATSTTQLATTAFVHAVAATISAGAMSQIANQIASGAPASITFSSIPGTFNHLKFIIVARCATVTIGNNSLACFLNADNGAHYDATYTVGQGGASPTGAQLRAASQWTYTSVDELADAGNTAGVGTYYEFDFPLYAGTTFFKNGHESANYFDGTTANVDAVILESALSWRSTAAITSVTFSTAFTTTFATGSAFYLYGLT